ncbi:hypothetical protein ISTM_156 [Insectomime virus]|uniref:MORN repeat-containing protein n=1 Tax=Tunisvirus fontaine2 TaxID=1421067 RepID=V9SGJ1_9VIRU|nr:hypothetical protein D1R32_gp165 [Tunisvirus fontaine2]AHA46054.1 hypothetical protein ISTM_156 [Insectomime virus]AHC54882.1 hypothetical protein TNS_ORF164 [Tunisvirus fontaine2]
MLKFLDDRETIVLSLVANEMPRPEDYMKKVCKDDGFFFVLPDGTKHGKCFKRIETMEVEYNYNFGKVEGPYTLEDWKFPGRIHGNFLDGKPHGAFVFGGDCRAFYEHGKMVHHKCGGHTCDIMCSRLTSPSQMFWEWEEHKLVVYQIYFIRMKGTVTKKIAYSDLLFVDEETMSEKETVHEKETPDSFLGTFLDPFVHLIPRKRIVAKTYEDESGTYSNKDGWTVPYFLY